MKKTRLKKIRFTVVVCYEREDEQTDTTVTIKREKTFEGAESYQQALDYYEKQKQAADSRYTMDEAGLHSSAQFEGKKYVGEYCEFVTASKAWICIEMSVKIVHY